MLGKQMKFEGLPKHTRLCYAEFERGETQEEDSVQLSCDDPIAKKVVVCIELSEPGWGFGTFTIVQSADGVFIDTECTSKEKVKKAFSDLIDSAIVDHEKDPEKHLLYNKNTGTRCGAWCKTCHPEEKKQDV